MRLPGDGKTALAAARRADGLRLARALRRDLVALAGEYGLPAPFEAVA